MKFKRFTIWITIALLLIGLSAAFAYGKINADKTGDGTSYFDSMNNYDWSKTCPAAGCRNNNED